jgi:hypothetical protein
MQLLGQPTARGQPALPLSDPPRIEDREPTLELRLQTVDHPPQLDQLRLQHSIRQPSNVNGAKAVDRGPQLRHQELQYEK